MPLPPGSRLGAYEILDSLGEGGMGEVYRARDARLGRDVALKILPPDVVREPGRLERFDREARAIAALNHPHIVTLYSTEEADGVRFLTMELVEGKTLTEAIVAGGMSIARFLDIAVPLADALTAAHQKEITHRDLKPANVMVTHDGRVKVLDFGLARVGGPDNRELSLAATLAPVTQHGTIVGTMPYMSPEQVEGAPVDSRSDLFSLGVIFYELLTGERPFQGASSPALMSAILRDTPSDITTIRADVPDSLVRLISRCLEKRPEDRVQTARDVYNELRHVQRQFDSSATRRASGSGAGPAAAMPDTLSVAVLPFGVRSGDADADTIATGLTEDIAGSISKFYGLSVVAPQSARAYKDSTFDIRQIAERLNARYIIGGSVRKAGAAVRVTAHVVDAHTGATLWSETYNRQLGDADIFTVQDDLTDHIVATVADMSGVLARSMVQSVRQHTSLGKSTARELVLRSWGSQQNPTPGEHAELRAALEAKLTQEPDNPHLWAHLAAAYIAEHSLFFNPLPDPLDRALRAARRAIELDRESQKGWESLAIAYFHLKDPHGMQDALERAIRINPRNANTMAWMGNILTHSGEYDRGCAITERAMAINPGHPGWLHFAVFNRHFARKEFAEALDAARRVNIPEFVWMHLAIAAACGQLGLAKEGRIAYEAITRIAPMLAEEADRREFVTRWFWPAELIESLLNGVDSSRAAAVGSRTASYAAPADASPLAATSPASAERRTDPGERSAHGTATPGGGLRVAVLPFVSRTGDEEAAAVAEALTEDITTGLSRFGNLRVLSKVSADRLATARSSGDASSARYVIDGSVRRAGTSMRVSVRLADSATGANLWAEQFNLDTSHGGFTSQDEIANRIVATVGDQTGVLANAMATALGDMPLDQLGVPELVVRYHSFTMHLREEEHGRLRAAFERAVEREPRAAGAWACLAMLYEMEHSHNFNPRTDPLVRQRHAAQRAVEADPQSQQAWTALASAHLFARDLPALRGAVERAVRLNPLNADLVALCALFLSVAGDADRALTLARNAAQVKPNHPGWYHFTPVNTHYLRGEYEDALREAKLINMPHLVLAHMAAAAAAGQVGRAAEAQSALDALRTTAPALLDPQQARHVWSIWIWNEEFLDRLAEGFAKALALTSGTIAPRPPAPLSKPADSDSGVHSAFTVNVLPFQSPASGDAAALSEGLAQGIVVGLSRFQYLRVISTAVAPEAIAAGYKLQGSVREGGGVVRVVMQLSDAQTGANVWAETYDRDLRKASLFDLQDELTATIVATIADTNGALVRSMSAIVRGKPVHALTPYEAVLRRFAYISVMSPAEHALVREALELAVKRAPDYAAAWAVLAQIYVDEFAQDYNARPNPLERARAAADKALDIDPSSQHAYVALATIGFFSKDHGAFRAAADRALALNPLDSTAMSLLGTLTAYSGDWDTGLALSARARTLNPHHPGVYWLVLIVDRYRHGDYTGALEILNRVNMPSFPTTLLVRAAIYAQLGRIDEGRVLLREAETRAPGMTAGDGRIPLRWFTPDLFATVQEGLDKLTSD